MTINESLVRGVVEEVLKQITNRADGAAVGCPGNAYHSSCNSARGHNGIFTDANDAVAASVAAYDELSHRTIAERKKIVGIIRRVAIDQSVELGTMEMNETKIGRLVHKIDKLQNLGHNAPGVEFLKSEVFSGDYGLTVIEFAPFGVIGAVTPVTHSLPTILNNAINMISSGNTLVVNPHPSGKRVAAEGVRRCNELILREHGIDNLVSVIAEPTLQTADVIFKHPNVSLLVVTGGPAVAKAALSQQKRAIVAGPGNPPVVVDETADFDNAARSIIAGAAYDNNLLCIAEKEVFVVESVFEVMMKAMERAGAVRLNAQQVDQFTQKAIVPTGEGASRHLVPSREFLGKDAAVLANGIGLSIPQNVELLYGETDESNPFVPVEQMMPFVPFVRVKDIDHGIDLAKKYEHGFRHTAIIHSSNVRNMTKMGKALETTIFVKNGACTAGLGGGGEGYPSFSIAGPTGEGITTPLTFTRQRRCVLVDSLHVLGK
ncbi:MAG: aldehyde dehydrogenase EutE [Planctomycetaceae bacterium]|jgi:aldehyde dehydrogenase|nr:aldehyde dehydrogenase EutE [Planctomycetaceae bacterium]